MGDLTKLLPCPWCGGTLKDGVVLEGDTFRWRRVQGCCTDGPEVRIDTLSDDRELAEQQAKEQAYDAWNTRAALTPPEGWVLVPVEPTEEQLYAMEKWTSGGCPHLKEMYKASIIAAPPESPNA